MAATAVLELESEPLVAPAPGERSLPEEAEDTEHPMSETEAEAIEVVRESLRNLTEPLGAGLLVARYTRLEYLLKGRKHHYVPDLLVAWDVAPLAQDVYVVPQVGKAPELIVEVASPTTVGRDLTVKAGRYQALGVKEYFVFDPKHASEDLERRSLPLGVPLLGYYRNQEGEFEVELARGGKLRSRLLGVTLEVEGELLRLRGPDGQLIPSDRELAARAEERVRQLEAELSRLRGEGEGTGTAVAAER